MRTLWVGGLVDKPSWDIYFLTLAYITSQRSCDPHTVCGAVLVSENKHIMATGYNGPLSGSNDELIPTNRPDKYFYFLHAEENCLLAYNGSRQDLHNSTMYITGRPCHKCLRMILQRGIKRIVHTRNPAVCLDVSDMNAQETMIGLLRVSDRPQIIELNCLGEIKNLLTRTADYIDHKST